jgi:HAD superfamily hydrolase (TIGR01509 family)
LTTEEREYRALIFDFDGLILDTEGPEFQSWSEVYAAHGVALDLESWASCIGTIGGFEPFGELEARLGRPIDREAIREQRRRRNQELLTAERVRPGIESYLDSANRLGLRVGVASSSPRSWVAGHLERLGLLDRFHCLRTADDVRTVKPDPELYLAATSALGVEPAAAIAIEDSPNGALAAKRAGLVCVAVPNALTRQLDLAHADLRLDSLADVSLEELLVTLGGRSRDQ